MFKRLVLTGVTATMLTSASYAASEADIVGDEVIAKQRAALAAATGNLGYGPQSPRDIDAVEGENLRSFGPAPAMTKMALCDIHFHENAEHKGGQFTTFAGNGDGSGNGTGFKYDGTLTEAELAPIDVTVGKSEHGDLIPGDTIEIHFVYSTAKAKIGNGLGTCLSDAIGNPQLRVESVVAVLVSDGGSDFTVMADFKEINGLNQTPNLPNNLGEPVMYAGSTTGPGYNEKASPYQVTWNVRPSVVKLDILSVNAWLKDNPFGESHAHGVRNLVKNPFLLSRIN